MKTLREQFNEVAKPMFSFLSPKELSIENWDMLYGGPECFVEFHSLMSNRTVVWDVHHHECYTGDKACAKEHKLTVTASYPSRALTIDAHLWAINILTRLLIKVMAARVASDFSFSVSTPTLCFAGDLAYARCSVFGLSTKEPATPKQEEPTFDSLRKAFGRDDVKILRVDGRDETMPDKITLQIGEKLGVFVQEREPAATDPTKEQWRILFETPAVTMSVNDKTKAGMAIVWNLSFDGTWSWLVAGKTGTAKTGLLAMDAAMEASEEGSQPVKEAPADNDLPALKEELINEAQLQRNRHMIAGVWDNSFSDELLVLAAVVGRAINRAK